MKKGQKKKSDRAKPSKRQLSFIDIFAGCGGISLGLLKAGWKGLFAIEKDSNAFQTLRENLIVRSSRHRFSWPKWLPKSPHEIRDVLQEYSENLTAIAGSVDLLVGGPPCQGFSTAGRRDPQDPRNKLVEAYLEFVKCIKPKVVLIENVRGITADFEDTSSPGGSINYAAWIKTSLSVDYTVASRMIDTSSFGVPQNRHRFFIIAVLREVAEKIDGCPFKLIETSRLSFLKTKGLVAVPIGAKTAISDLEINRNGTIPSPDSKGFDAIAYSEPLTSYQRLMNAGMTGQLPDTRLARHSLKIKKRFAEIIKLCHADGRLNVSLSSELRASFGLRKCAIRVLDPDRAAPTITSMPDDLIHYSEPRALTVRENARLQSFPDWFAFHGKYTTGGDRRRKEVPRFTQVANAVPPLMAEVIGIALAKYLKKPAALSKPPKGSRKFLGS